MLFERRLQKGLVDGSISLAFRRWKRRQAIAGRQYRSPIGLVDVTRIDLVDAPEISEADARAAGYSSVGELLDDLPGASDGELYRVELRRAATADQRDELAEESALSERQLGDLRRKLDRFDSRRAWTTSVLRAIDEHPATRAADLAAALGWPDLLEFKLHVRKLKALGLTISLEKGYRLSPRGRAYLDSPGVPG